MRSIKDRERCLPLYKVLALISMAFTQYFEKENASVPSWCKRNNLRKKYFFAFDCKRKKQSILTT